MSVSNERRVVGYLKPQRHLFIAKYAALNEISASQALNEAVKKLQETMPPDMRERVDRYDKNKHSY